MAIESARWFSKFQRKFFKLDFLFLPSTSCHVFVVSDFLLVQNKPQPLTFFVQFNNNVFFPVYSVQNEILLSDSALANSVM